MHTLLRFSGPAAAAVPLLSWNHNSSWSGTRNQPKRIAPIRPCAGAVVASRPVRCMDQGQIVDTIKVRNVDYMKTLGDVIGDRGASTLDEELSGRELELWRRHPLTYLTSDYGGQLIATDKFQKGDKSGHRNATFYELYKAMTEYVVSHPQPGVYWTCYFGFGKKYQLPKEVGQSHTILDFLEVRGPSDLTPGEVSNFFKGYEEDGREWEAFKVIAGEPLQDVLRTPVVPAKHLKVYQCCDDAYYPPLTAFRCVRQETCPELFGKTVYVLEPAWSTQLFSESLLPPADIWAAVKSGTPGLLTSWLQNHPAADLESAHPEHGCSLLYSASRYGHVACAQALLDACAHVNNQMSAKCSSPLHVAAFRGHADVTKLLLEHGADASLLNSYGLSPVQEANSAVAEFIASLPSAPGALTGNWKLAADGKELRYGNREDFLEGLGRITGSPLMSLEEEFQRNLPPWQCNGGTHTDIDVWQECVAGGGCCVSGSLDELMHTAEAETAGLTRGEALALRLYTSPAYWPLNRWLRDLKAAVDQNDESTIARLRSAGHSWARFALEIEAAMSKLLKSQPATTETRYRGVNGVVGAEALRPDKRGMVIFTEHAFMSTSARKASANQFLRSNGMAIMFEICPRGPDAFGLHDGAPVEWLTMYPGEHEILFPPYTMLNVFNKQRGAHGSTGKLVTLSCYPTFKAS